MKRSLLTVLLIAAVVVSLVWVGLRERGGEAGQPLVNQIQDALDADVAKGRFTGELGDFVVYKTVDGQAPPEAQIVICPATNPVTDPAILGSHELWSDAFGPTSTGWACDDGEIVSVNNVGPDGPAPGPGLSKLYFETAPLALLRDAPQDRLELMEVGGHPALLERPVDVYPYAMASLAVIERFPQGDLPGIAVFVNRASSVDEAINLAEKLIP